MHVLGIGATIGCFFVFILATQIHFSHLITPKASSPALNMTLQAYHQPEQQSQVAPPKKDLMAPERLTAKPEMSHKITNMQPENIALSIDQKNILPSKTPKNVAKEQSIITPTAPALSIKNAVIKEINNNQQKPNSNSPNTIFNPTLRQKLQNINNLHREYGKTLVTTTLQTHYSLNSQVIKIDDKCFTLRKDLNVNNATQWSLPHGCPGDLSESDKMAKNLEKAMRERFSEK